MTFVFTCLMLDPTRPDPQALGRRYCARCSAIRLAQSQISKYIEPTKQLPYWVNPVTSVTTWTKPKIFGASDVGHAMMVATSRTEHLVRNRYTIFPAAATASVAPAAVCVGRSLNLRAVGWAFPTCCTHLLLFMAGRDRLIQRSRVVPHLKKACM